jgi:recombination protein RecA
VRLDIRRIQTLKKGSDQYGIRAKVKVAKNKVAPPFRIAEFDILFGHGISRLGCLLDLAEETNIINRRGAWYSYNGDNIGQGRDNAIKYLEENAEFAQTIEQDVLKQLEMGAMVSANSVNPKKRDDDSLEEEEEEEEIYEEVEDADADVDED